MTENLAYNSGYGTSGVVRYVPTTGTSPDAAGFEVTPNAEQVLTVYNNAKDSAGYGSSLGSASKPRKKPCLINIAAAGWQSSGLASSLQATGTANNKLMYDLVRSGDWVVVDAEVTSSGAAVTGGGAAHPPWTPQWADTSRAFWAKDVLHIIQHVKRFASIYGIDKDRIYLMGASSSAHIQAWAAYRSFLAGEFGADPSTYVEYAESWEVAGVIGYNMPYGWMGWAPGVTVVGQGFASAADPDVPGTTKASVSPEYIRAFSPIYWLADKARARRVPTIMAYTDPTNVDEADKDTAFATPFKGLHGVETGVHPVSMGMLAQRQFNKGGFMHKSGLPWWTTVRTNTTGALIDNSFANGDSRVLRLPDISGGSIGTPLHRKFREWLRQLDYSESHEFYTTPRQRDIVGKGTAEPILLAPANPWRTQPVRISVGRASGSATQAYIFSQDEAVEPGAATVGMGLSLDLGAGNETPGSRGVEINTKEAIYGRIAAGTVGLYSVLA